MTPCESGLQIHDTFKLYTAQGIKVVLARGNKQQVAGSLEDVCAARTVLDPMRGPRGGAGMSSIFAARFGTGGDVRGSLGREAGAFWTLVEAVR